MPDETLPADVPAPERTEAVPNLPILDVNATAAGAPTKATLARANRPTVAGYDLIEVVGKGGMGVVYRARQLGLERDIAIKFLRDEFHPKSATGLRFLEEARITAQLQHPGIPAVHEVGTLPDGRPYLAMKLIRGNTLDSLLKKDGPGSGKWLPVFEAICQAVGFAHAHGVVHRDLKPSNVMVGAFGEVQVMDWGLAKLVGREALGKASEENAVLDEDMVHSSRTDESLQTRAGSYLGTPAFMAPEQATGAVDAVTARTDVFGLGAVLCTLLTGQPPYLGTTSETTRLLAAATKQDEALERLEKCGAEPEIIALCKHCLAALPGDRPADGTVVAKQIAGLRQAADERARVAEIDKAKTEVAAAEQGKRRRVMLYAAGGIAAVMTLGMIGTGIMYFEAVDARGKETQAKQLAQTNEARAVESEGKAIENEQKAVAARNDAVANEKKAVAQQKIATSTLNFFLKDLLGQADSETAFNAMLARGGQSDFDRNPTIGTLLNNAAEKMSEKEMEKNFPGLPGVQAKILQIVANTYRGIGQGKDSIPFLKRAVAIVEQLEGPQSHETLKVQSELGLAFLSENNPREAAKFFQKVNDVNMTKHGAWHGNTISSTSNLAVALQQQGQFVEAIRLLETARANALKNPELGPGDPTTLIIEVKLARAYQDAKRTREAIALFEAVRDAYVKRYTAEHPQTLGTENDLAGAYLDVGTEEFNAKSIGLYKRVLAAFTKVLGPNHPNTLTAENNLAFAYYELKNPDEAIRTFEHVRTLQIDRYGPFHPDSVTATNNLAQLIQRSNPDRAVELFQEAARGAIKLQNTHRASADIYEALGANLEKKRKYAEAEEWFRNWNLVVKQDEKYGEKSAKYSTTCAVLGRNLTLQKKWSEAVPFYRECLAIRAEIMPGTWGFFNVQSVLGGALWEAGEKKDEGCRLMESGFEGLTKTSAAIPANAWSNYVLAGERLLKCYEAGQENAKAEALKKKLPPKSKPNA